MFLFGYESSVSTVWKDASVSGLELQPTEKNYLRCCPTNKAIKSTGMQLFRLRNLSHFPLQYCTLIALVVGRCAVAKPSGGFPLQYRPLIA